MINGTSEKRISTNFKSVKIRSFSGNTIDEMHFNLIPLLRKKPVVLILHVGTNNSPDETSSKINSQLLNLVQFIKENKPNCYVVLSPQIDRLDDGKAAHTIKRLNTLLLHSSLEIINNSKLDIVFLVCVDCI